MPKLYAGGALIVGDSASFLNAARIKGIHLAMKSGMLAAETAFDAMVSGDSSEEALAAYMTHHPRSDVPDDRPSPVADNQLADDEPQDQQP